MQQNLFNQVISLLNKYQKNILLNERQKHILAEVITRLNSVTKLYTTITESNTFLLNKDPNIIKGRESRDENIDKIMQAVGRKLVKKESEEVGAYNMNSLDVEIPQHCRLIQQLHLNTESFYHNLWIINQKLKQLPKFKNFKPEGVRNVRNRLIDHTDESNSGACIFSFGVGTHGPVLRPIKPVGIQAPHDRGLETNTEEFLSSIVRILGL